jgi:ketosteroid isomerase-like protein
MVTSLVVAFAFGRQMYGSHEQQVREEIQATYDGYADSVLHGQLDRTMSFLTPDIVWVYPNGKEQHGSEIRAVLKAWEDSIKPGTKLFFTIEQLKIDSEDQLEAFVTLHSRMPGSKGPDQKSHWHDTWVKSHGRWQNSRGVALAPAKKS